MSADGSPNVASDTTKQRVMANSLTLAHLDF
jgi:hypothetical protein